MKTTTKDKKTKHKQTKQTTESNRNGCELCNGVEQLCPFMCVCDTYTQHSLSRVACVESNWSYTSSLYLLYYIGYDVIMFVSFCLRVDCNLQRWAAWSKVVHWQKHLIDTRDIRSPHIFAYWSQIGDDTMTMQYAEGIQVCQLHCIVIAAWGKNHARHRLHLPQSKWTKSSVWMRMQRSICCELSVNSVDLILLLSCIFPHTPGVGPNLIAFAYSRILCYDDAARFIDHKKYSVRHTHWIRTRLVDCYSI